MTFCRPLSLLSCRLLVMLAFFGYASLRSPAAYAMQEPAQVELPDTDRDGLSDEVEQALLSQFEPAFWVGKNDCSNLPSEFSRDVKTPTVEREDGTIYGQAFVSGLAKTGSQTVELHYYHLWKTDCGEHGHPLDTEHVAALVRRADDGSAFGHWTAVYWYAAAHENTVCDVSQIARASTVDAVDHGAKVWISPGKHASYLSESFCREGCGADRCEAMVPLKTTKIVNLGEIGHPMNGSLFISSTAWPLAAKMSSTNFPAETIARLEVMPKNDVALFNAGRHPAQGVIAVSGTTGGAILNSGENRTGAIGVAGDSTGNALEKSYRNTKHALGASVRSVGKALHVTPKSSEKPEE
jgi:hypothetical protein